MGSSRFVLVAVVALVLSACSTPSDLSNPSWTREAVDEALSEATTTLSTAAAAWPTDAAVQALSSPEFGTFLGGAVTISPAAEATMDPSALLSMIVPAATSTLPTGTMTYDPVAGAFVQTSSTPADDLLLVWTFDYIDPGTLSTTTYAAEALFDWNNSGGNDLGSSEPILVTTATSDLVEVPTAMRLTLDVGPSGGSLAPAADVEATISWFADCAGVTGPIDDIASVMIDGSLGLAHVLSFDMVTLSIQDAASRLDTSGTITYAGLHAASVAWDVTLQGDVIRSACYFAGIDITAGSIDVSVTVEPATGPARSIGIDVTFDSVVTGSFGELVSANVSGSMTIDGSTALTFSGTMDDADADGVPGENVTVTYGDGSTSTLEDLLRGHASPTLLSVMPLP